MGDLLECDIVMKGGITSGVVYPRAATELARRYKFRKIGGTSAGAIAAAVVAAAEHNRAGGGFKEVEELPGRLGQKGFMLELFRPDTKTRPLFEALVGFMKHGVVGGGLSLLRWFPLLLALPLLLIPVGILITLIWHLSAAYAVAAALLAVLAFLAGLAIVALRAIKTLGANDFGICHLGPSKAGQALTPWLHDVIQRAAGLGADDPPLTFGKLWGGDPLVAGHEGAERAIDLQMITTDLSRGRPMRLPVPLQRHRDVLEEGDGLLFVEEEMARYFPPAVVRHLVEKGSEPNDETAERLAAVAPGTVYRHFPLGADMPVVVATRMSLSFPILIAAVKLWELDFGADPYAPPIRPVVFSDGGITSNFPIHFFDSPLPKRPTFGLQLTKFPPGEKPDPNDPGRSVEGPPTVDDPPRPLRADIDSTPGFLGAIMDAMQNWPDNTQAALPGYRERIVQIKMAPDEGGMNLDMPPELIKQLTARGAVAGDRLSTAFSGPLESPPISTPQWNDHRFVRYRVVMSALERFLRSYADGWTAKPPVTTPYPDRVGQGLKAPYAFGSAAEVQAALDTSVEYVSIAADSEKHSLDDEGVPRPPATLRTVPPV